MAWKYEKVESTFDEIPEGNYRCRIADADMAVSKSGNDMLVIRLEINGFTSNLWNYIAFLEDRPEITNRLLTQMFDSFGIEAGDFELSHYINKVGACHVKHDEEGKARIGYFIAKNKQSTLPPWKGSRSAEITQDVTDDDNGEWPWQ